MSKTYFIVADVHSYYYEMIDALKDAGFNKDDPNHIFVSLGDLLDRGNFPDKCLDFVNSLSSDRKILIRGNHEDLMEEAITRGAWGYHDFSNGTVKTACLLNHVCDYEAAREFMRSNEAYNTYIRSCVDYFETETAIFVHGWIPLYIERKGFIGEFSRYGYWKNWRPASFKEWEKARWYNGMDAWANGVREPNKTIYCGHWHTSWARSFIDMTCNPRTRDPEDFKPWINEGIVALDACTALTGFVNCYVLKEEVVI